MVPALSQGMTGLKLRLSRGAEGEEVNAQEQGFWVLGVHVYD